MIAGRRHPLPQIGRRRHRPHIAVWAALVVVAAIVVGEVTADVVNSGVPASELAAKTYAAAVVPIIEESTALRPWLTDVRRQPVGLGRVGLETALGRLVSGARNLESQLANLGIPAPDARSSRLVREVLARRETAARLLTGGIALAIGPARDVTAAAAPLVNAGEELARSDADYARFVSLMPAYVRDSVPFPPSRWDDPAEWTPPALSSFAALLGSSPSLLVHRSLVIVAIALQPPALRIVGPLPSSEPTTTTSSTSTNTTTTTSTTVPELVTSSSVAGTTTTSTSSTTSTTTTTLQVPPAGSISCIAPTRRLTVDVVVANAGNVPASSVDVVASLAEQARSLGGATRSPTSGARSKKRRTITRTKGGAAAVSPSCEAGASTAKTGAAPSGRSGRSGAGGSVASATVSRLIARLAAGTSEDLALPPIPVAGGSTYVLTVRLGGRSESVRLQVASG